MVAGRDAETVRQQRELEKMFDKVVVTVAKLIDDSTINTVKSLTASSRPSATGSTMWIIFAMVTIEQFVRSLMIALFRDALRQAVRSGYVVLTITNRFVVDDDLVVATALIISNTIKEEKRKFQNG